MYLPKAKQNNPILYASCSFCPSVLSHDRFLDVVPQCQQPTNEGKWNNSDITFEDKLSQTFTSVANINSKRPTAANKQLRLDLRMHPLWGRVSFRDHSPQKPNKHCTKLFVLTQWVPHIRIYFTSCLYSELFSALWKKQKPCQHSEC